MHMLLLKLSDAAFASSQRTKDFVFLAEGNSHQLLPLHCWHCTFVLPLDHKFCQVDYSPINLKWILLSNLVTCVSVIHCCITLVRLLATPVLALGALDSEGALLGIFKCQKWHRVVSAWTVCPSYSPSRGDGSSELLHAACTHVLGQ